MTLPPPVGPAAPGRNRGIMGAMQTTHGVAAALAAAAEDGSEAGAALAAILLGLLVIVVLGVVLVKTVGRRKDDS